MRALRRRIRAEPTRSRGPRPYRRLSPDLPTRTREIPRPFVADVDLEGPSLGGLYFEVTTVVRPGTVLEIAVTVEGETLRFRGTVHWVRSLARRFEVAVRLTNREDAFRARVAVQLGYMEAHRGRLSRLAGHAVGAEQAAHDWIARHAARFSRAWAAGTD